MPHTLLLRLPAPGEEETEWLSIGDSGAPSAARQRGPLSLAAAVARSARVVALAPASHMLLAEPELPPGSGPKLARAVPFALEEQLTEDVDQLCFALGRRLPNGRTPVAVVARTTLKGWLAQLAAAGIEIVETRRTGVYVTDANRAYLQAKFDHRHLLDPTVFRVASKGVESGDEGS